MLDKKKSSECAKSQQECFEKIAIIYPTRDQVQLMIDKDIKEAKVEIKERIYHLEGELEGKMSKNMFQWLVGILITVIIGGGGMLYTKMTSIEVELGKIQTKLEYFEITK